MISPASGKAKVVFLAVIEKMVVDKFRAIITVDPKQRKTQPLLDFFHRIQCVRSGLIYYGITLRPTTGDIGAVERVDILSAGGGTQCATKSISTKPGR